MAAVRATAAGGPPAASSVGARGRSASSAHRQVEKARDARVDPLRLRQRGHVPASRDVVVRPASRESACAAHPPCRAAPAAWRRRTSRAPAPSHRRRHRRRSAATSHPTRARWAESPRPRRPGGPAASPPRRRHRQSSRGISVPGRASGRPPRNAARRRTSPRSPATPRGARGPRAARAAWVRTVPGGTVPPTESGPTHGNEGKDVEDGMVSDSTDDDDHANN